MLYILITLAILLTLWILGELITNKVGKEINGFYRPFRAQNNELFLKEIDFSDGDYMLYVKHKEFGAFAVIDEQKLIANKDSVKINLSWANYFPGEGNRSYGLMLFKDNKLFKQKNGGIFNIFEIGNLKNHAVSVNEHRFNGTKKEVEQKIELLMSQKKSFIIYKPTLPKEDKEFHFRIYFPSIAVPVTRAMDSHGSESITTVDGVDYQEWYQGNDNGFNGQWEKHIEDCIRKKAGSNIDFDLSISSGILSDAYVFDVKQDWGGELRNPKNQILYLKDFMYYNYQAYIGASQEDAERLLAIDYTACISEVERRRPEVIAKMKQLVKQSTQPQLKVDNEEVGLSDYQDSTMKSKKLYEQEYFLNWLEIED